MVNASVPPESRSARVAGMSSSHLGCTTATSAAALCNISAVSESQGLRKPIHLVEVRATRKTRAQHNKGKRLELSEREEWEQKGPNGEKGKEKKLVDRKRVFAGKLKGIFDVKEEGLCKETGLESVRKGELSKAVRLLIG